MTPIPRELYLSTVESGEIVFRFLMTPEGGGLCDLEEAFAKPMIDWVAPNFKQSGVSGNRGFSCGFAECETIELQPSHR